MKKHDVEVIPNSERPADGRHRGRPFGPRIQALIDGKTLWCPGVKGSPNVVRTSSLKKAGLRAVTRQVERDGTKGLVIWAVPVDDENQ